MGTAIELRGVGKRYTKYDDLPLLVTTMSRMSRRKRRSKLWAVRGVDFEIAQGASFGIIGRNGSGKTTLMSMMAGVTAPTEGSLRIRGRIAPLIAVGVGFHQELTGRENVYLNATILGLTKKQVDERLDSIVDFAEIESFIDTPVKFYSSGMFVRLGFAVAIHCDPDVVLVDEVLAVGDLGFQVKCLERMARLVEGGTTVVMVSHNMAVLQRLAERVLLMDSGRPVYLGAPEAAIARFHELLDEQPAGMVNEFSGVRFEPGVVEVTSVELAGPDGEPVTQVEAGTPVTVRLTVKTTTPLPAVAVGYTFTGPDGQVVYMDSNIDRPFGPVPAGERLSFTMSIRASLPTGSYSVNAWVQRPLKSLLARSRNVSFYVTGRTTVKGAADLGGVITMDEVSSELPEAVS
ncbi:MAG TPA: ABC transporter ATP-binding protein [Acidimicrobiaceae bacterium]|nr:ABC transporter ATP-binding protein [Acidimicrobiaceae bacterium]